ncbi:hypothetical protein ACSV4D_01995 [Flavobacterium sp. ARAG 55.4]|uniref:hypothetical protein n=1 Tax=Flavobacterium sp. ARAG 55.4 TaxID=3451357 RepID=UPI003F47133A
MKKLAPIFLFISALTLLFTSCANDKDDKSKNFVKIIESTKDGITENSVFTYKENQIISADNTKEKTDYTYQNGLITKITTYNKATQLTSVLNYTYDKEKLIKVSSTEKYVIYYTHNGNDKVSYQKYTIDSQNKEQKVLHGILYFKNKNLIKDECIFDNVTENSVSGSKTTFDYDTYNNPYFSILGYEKLLDHGVLISKNNAVMTVAETTVTQEGQAISSANMYTTKFKYDADDYPTEQISEESLMNPDYSKIQYLY